MSTHSTHTPPSGHHDLATGNHEYDDIAFGAIIKVGVMLAVVTLGSYLIVLGVYGVLERQMTANEPARAYPLAAGLGDRLPPEPRLQTTPKQDLLDFRAGDAELLDSYRWVDKNAGIVRIPIEQAMRLTLERSLPSRGADAATPAARDAAK